MREGVACGQACKLERVAASCPTRRLRHFTMRASQPGVGGHAELLEICTPVNVISHLSGSNKAMEAGEFLYLCAHHVLIGPEG